jgi:hypothetical protein
LDGKPIYFWFGRNITPKTELVALKSANPPLFKYFVTTEFENMNEDDHPPVYKTEF